MKPRIKPIKNLYYQFIVGTEFEGRIEPQDLAVEMHKDGKIDLIGHQTKPLIEHYRETQDFSAWSDEDKSEAVFSIMVIMREGE